MSSSNPITTIKHSLYWLLPVILLNVFTSAGLQASVVELPFQAQTELQFTEAPAMDAPFVGHHSIVTGLITAPVWPGLLLNLLPTTPQSIPPAVSVHPTTKSLSRFYGKAALEALDAWRRH